MTTLTSTAAVALGTARGPATCSVSASECGSLSTVSTLDPPHPPGYRGKRIRKGAGTPTPLLLRGPRQLHRNVVNNWRCTMWPRALGNVMLHRLREPHIHWRHLVPRHVNVDVLKSLFFFFFLLSSGGWGKIKL